MALSFWSVVAVQQVWLLTDFSKCIFPPLPLALTLSKMVQELGLPPDLLAASLAKVCCMCKP